MIANAFAASLEKPAWLDNSLGKDEVTLPGYEPLSASQNTISLGMGRKVVWNNSYLPAEISANALPIAHDMRLVVRHDGQSEAIVPEKVYLKEVTDQHAVMVSEGHVASKLLVRVTTRIEYDGVAMVTINLIPSGQVHLEGLDYLVDVEKNQKSRVITFKADDIQKQKNRYDLIALPYRGDFLNVIGIADGDRSFWWFADNAEHWVWNGSTVSEISQSGDSYRIRQRLVGERWSLKGSVSLKLNFLVTPVRDIGADWRKRRIIAGAPDDEKAQQGGFFKMWWTDAFVHDALPYTELPESITDEITVDDRNSYRGAAENRKMVEHDRQQYGAHWMPYFSAHALSNLDPGLQIFRDSWQIEPHNEFREVVLPYTHIYGKPLLTHRAESYTDYLIWRLAEAIDTLDIDGIYLDHGPVRPSMSVRNGGWMDSNGKLQPSLDILGTREFIKRLRTLFWRKGKTGYVFVHDSNREIIPAYTFAYAQYTGEQYRSGVVRNGKYLDAVSLDELRTRLAADQYGVLTVWLPIEWTYHRDNKRWRGSESQLHSYRSYESLALLLDVMTHPLGSHKHARDKLLAVLDKFGIEKANFIGYWDAQGDVDSSNPGVKISVYRRNDTASALYIATNSTNKNIKTRVTFNAASQSPDASIVIEGRKLPESISHKFPEIDLDVPANDFRWIISGPAGGGGL